MELRPFRHLMGRPSQSSFQRLQSYRKTPHEALGVPTKGPTLKDCAARSRLSTCSVTSSCPNTGHVVNEMMIISAETRCIVDKCFELGNGDLAVGTVRAFQAGVIDVPFAPSKLNAKQDAAGQRQRGSDTYSERSQRSAESGTDRFQQRKDRRKSAGRKTRGVFQMVIDDVYSISKGRLVGKTLEIKDRERYQLMRDWRRTI